MGGLAVGGGIGGVIILILGLLMGQNPLDYINNGNPKAYQEETSAEADEKAQFVSVVLKDTEDVWNKLFEEQGADYQEPVLVLFSGTDQSGCGHASAATGPFYCPLDSKVYIDLSFYDQLRDRFGAPGDFAMAYVIAHEVGHHIQNLEGTLERAHQAQQSLGKAEGNAIQVGVELQADCYAGVWAANARDAQGSIIEPGDIEEGMRAAEAIGDDTLQRQTQGAVVPESFTHGSSAQRMEALRRGMQSGNPAACNYAR